MVVVVEMLSLSVDMCTAVQLAQYYLWVLAWAELGYYSVYYVKSTHSLRTHLVVSCYHTHTHVKLLKIHVVLCYLMSENVEITLCISAPLGIELLLDSHTWNMMYSVLCNPELSKIVDFHFHIYTSYVFFQSYLITSLLLVVYSLLLYSISLFIIALIWNWIHNKYISKWITL